MNQENLYGAYCIDTCAILDFWSVEHYGPRPYHVKVSSFRNLWNHIASSIENGRIILLKPVVDEIQVSDPELLVWFGKKKGQFTEFDALQELKDIVNKYNIYTSRKISMVDPMVVAMAKKNGWTVLTSERLTSSPTTNGKKAPKIPNICKDFEVDCISLLDFFSNEGL